MIRQGFVLTVLALSTALSAAEGELCFVGRSVPDCRPVTGDRLRVAPAEVERPFVWWDGNRTGLALGVLPAGGETIAREKWRTVPLLLEGDDPQSWPQPVTIRLKFPARRVPAVEAVIGARATGTLRRIHYEPREGTLELIAPHHRPVVLSLAHDGPAAVRFTRYPAISGMVIDSETRLPTAGAEVFLPSDELLARTGPDGRFVADVTEGWPAQIRVKAPERAARTLDVPPAVRSFDAGVVELSKGGTLRVVLDREKPVALELTRRGDRDSKPVARRDGARGAVDIAGLAPGSYDLLVRGDEPLQRLTMAVQIRDAQTAEVVPDIRPVDLLVRVRAGARAVAAAQIAIGPANGAWTSTVTTDEEGVARHELWDRGDFGAFVTGPGVDTFAHRILAGSTGIEWIIEAPTGRVAGTVRDAEGGSPVRGARVTLETDGGGAVTQVAVDSDADGRFSFSNVAPGAQTLIVDARGYVRGARSFHLEPDRDAGEQTIRLDRALEQTFAVSLANGRPAAGAVLVDAVTMQQHLADDQGLASVGFRAGEQRTLYVLPREGSFTAVEASAPRGAPVPVRVTVPPGDAVIVIHARSTSGDPVPGIRFAVRYNGRVLSEAVRTALYQQHGFPFATGSDGTAMLRNVPAGLYELWPYAGADEREAIEWGVGPAPVSLAARAGINDVILTFTK